MPPDSGNAVSKERMRLPYRRRREPIWPPTVAFSPGGAAFRGDEGLNRTYGHRVACGKSCLRT